MENNQILIWKYHWYVVVSLLSIILHAYFPSSKGLRQGDPPHLFAIVMECLSLLLQICEEAKLKKFPYSKDGVSVSHLLFADDLMIFPNPGIHSVKNLTLAFR